MKGLKIFAFSEDYEGLWPKIARIGSIGAVMGVCTLMALVAAGLGPGIELNQTSTVSPDPALIAHAAEVYRARTAPAPLSSPDQVTGARTSLNADQAYRINASIPISRALNPAAQPFVLQASAQERGRAVECLTAAVYYEAAYESDAGQRAVAQVVLNRVRHPAFPKDVCGVVFQGSSRKTGCQFSFTCDGSLARKPAPALWARARQVANSALSGSVMAGVGGATHYHTVYVAPQWSGELVKVRKIGAHLFYRWKGAGGLPGAFTGAYVEPGATAEAPMPAPVQDIAMSTEDAAKKGQVATF